MTQVSFATNRNPNRKRRPDDFGDGFNPASPDNLRFGTARVEGGEVVEILVAEEKLHRDRSKSVHGSDDVFGNLRERMLGGADCLCFVHGYNVSFHEALVAGARLEEVYGVSRDLEVVVFSWPSDGSMMPFLAYKRDRDDAEGSGVALGRAFLKLQDFLHGLASPCGSCLHLLCHSMGNYVLRHGIQALRKQQGGMYRLFDEILLVAADEDHDAFEHDYKLSLLPELAQSVEVYFNRGDNALVISDRTKGNPTRLGSRGPRLPLALPGNVNLMDTSEVVGGLLEHSYAWDEPKVIADISAVLAGIAPDQIQARAYMPSQNRYVLR
jgi:esterase/lipase superfamily enzyme